MFFGTEPSPNFRAATVVARAQPADVSAAPRHTTSMQKAVEAESAKARVTLDWVTTRRAFDALEDDWNALFERAATSAQVFQSFNWCWHWCNHYLDPATEDRTHAAPQPNTLAVLTIRVDGALALVFPLVRDRAQGLNTLTWLGDPVSQYGDVLVDTRSAIATPDLFATAFAEIEAHQARTADMVRLRKVRSDSALATALKAKRAVRTRTVAAPFMDLQAASGFEDYEIRYSKRSRRNRKRLRRRLEDRGDTAFVTYRGGPQAADITRAAIKLKRQWLDARGLISPALADPRMEAFFSDVALGAVKPADCVVRALTSDGKPAAVEIALACKGAHFLHIIVYDMAFEKVGAGALLLEDSLRLGFDEKLQRYDFLAPADRYKMEWADGTVDVVDWAYGLTWRGRMWVFVYHGLLRERMKSLAQRLPKPIKAWLSRTLLS